MERLDDGEVSPYLTDELRPGDHVELRGPVGGYFVWEPPQGGPIGRLRPSQCMHDAKAISFKSLKLLAVNDVVPAAR